MDMLNEKRIQCPYCGEVIEVLIDNSAGEQRYIEDCQVCCRPIEFAVSLDGSGEPVVSVWRDDE